MALPRGLYRHDAQYVMVRYDHNSMVLPNDEYVERGYLPEFDQLPSHAEWVAWHRANGSESQSYDEYVKWQASNGAKGPKGRNDPA